MHIRGARIAVAAVTRVAIVGSLAGCSGVQSWNATVTGPRAASTGTTAAAAVSPTPSDGSTATSAPTTVATPLATTAPLHAATVPPAAHPSAIPTVQPTATPTPKPTTPALAYKNGNYSATGTYTSPGGSETLRVTLTLGSDIVTALKVVSVKVDATAANYEAQFESGINAVVVGKDISSLNVGTVAGSSLTSIGFNNALATIKAHAKN
jgi:hypothetical protein